MNSHAGLNTPSTDSYRNGDFAFPEKLQLVTASDMLLGGGKGKVFMGVEAEPQTYALDAREVPSLNLAQKPAILS
jgi:hypothetical protein